MNTSVASFSKIRVPRYTMIFTLLVGLFAIASVADAQYNRYQQPTYNRYQQPNYNRYQQPNYNRYQQPNYNRYRTGYRNPYQPTQPRYVTPGAYAPNPITVKSAAEEDAQHAPVTPEQAQKLYNRPKTNPPPDFDPKSKWPRIAGEFEEQNAILISVSELLPQHGSVFKRVAELTEGHVPLVVLFNNTDQVLDALKALKETKQELKHVRFLKFELDTVWLRDFGPVLAEKEDGVMSIDFFYSGQRPTDDHFPRDWAKMIDAQHNSVPWTIQGGNLLCNGGGLALTTTRIFDDNKVQFKSTPGVDPVKEQQEFVINEFKKYTNLKHIEVLQPLVNESTKHVDMFATFVSDKDVVVADVDPQLDPANARILDYNAARLARITIGGEPLKVHRIPVPPRRGTSWSPYNNVIIANKLVMVPVMQTDDRSTMRKAIEVYRKALPKHRVATVDITSMAKLQGALHCMSIHVPSYVDIPKDKLVSYQRAVQWAKRLEEKEEADKEE